MNLILQVIKSLFRKVENAIAQTEVALTKKINKAQSSANSASKMATKAYNHADEAFGTADDAYSAANEATNAANSKMSKSNPTGTGSFSMNRKSGSSVGEYSHAEGLDGTASGKYSHAEGYNTQAIGMYSHAEGYNTEATGQYAHSEGRYNVASGRGAHAEGCSMLHGFYAKNVASGDTSHAEGANTTASGDISHAEGMSTTASGYATHAEGQETQAIGNYSHAEGFQTTATGDGSHSEGNETEAKGNFSHAEGIGTIAATAGHVQGRYNIEDTNSLDRKTGLRKYAHIVGNGTADNKRSNAHTVDWQGNAWFAGDVTVGGNWPTTLGPEGAEKLVKQSELESVKPRIGENGNWFIGDEDTGVSAGGNGSAEGGSTGGGGGNTTLFEVEVTVDEAVNRVDFTIPVSWYKVKLFNMLIDFGTVDTEFALYGIFGGEYKSLRTIEVGSDVGFDVYCIKHYTPNIFTMTQGYSKLSADAARPAGNTGNLTVKDSNTLALYSNTADVLLPAGTKVTLWGLYAND